MRRTAWGLLPLILLPALLLTALLTGCQRRLPPEQARGIMREIQEARTNLTLQGILTTSVCIGNEVVTATARINRGPGCVQMEYLTGRFAGWKVIEQDGKVWRIGPKGQIRPSSAGPDPVGMFFPRNAKLTMVQDGHGLVAGRTVDRYAVYPPLGGKARLDVAVDRENSYPLSMHRYGTDGRLLSSSDYTEINYQVAPPKRLAIPQMQQINQARGGHQVTEAGLAKVLEGPLLKPTYIPEGFELRGTYLQRTGSRQVAVLRYADGMRMLAVIQGKTSPRGVRKEPRNGRRWQRGRRNEEQAERSEHLALRSHLHANVLREMRGDRMVAVMGADVQPEELQKVLNSIPKAPGSSSKF